jgi:EAL and modified HD-GYP domain-containing signal transduction protein
LQRLAPERSFDSSEITVNRNIFAKFLAPEQEFDCAKTMFSSTYAAHDRHESDVMSKVFIGRQAIYSRELKTVAYELLFRSGDQNHAQFGDGGKATAELILNTFAEIGLERVVGRLPAFVNLPESFIVSGHSFSLPKQRVVLEVLEDVRPTQKVLAALSQLRQEGYTIAIDDFVYSPELMPLVELAHIVKVDLPAVPREELPVHVEILRQHDVRILAEKVETKEDFEFCKELNFDYYQGYFFCRPTMVVGNKLPVNRVSMMRLISRLQSSTAGLKEIADIIRTEPMLSFKLLRFVNSAQCGLTNKVESVQHAVALAGIRRIRTMASLSLLAEAAGEKQQQFVEMVLVRARMAETLAEQLCQARTDSFFLAGLFSAIDTLLAVPMEEALELVPVSDELKTALTTHEGAIGMVLDCVLAYERGAWDQVTCHTLDPEAIRNAYLEAIDWAATSINESEKTESVGEPISL